MLKDLFKKNKYITVSTTNLDNLNAEQKPNIPNGMWVKCDGCGKIIYNSDVDENLKVCPNCNYHFRLTAYERLKFTLDDNTFQEFDKDMKSANPLLPKLPNIIDEADSPQKFIFGNSNGELFATRNFSDPFPIWRNYKRMGCALRYVNQVKATLDKREPRC